MSDAPPIRLHLLGQFTIQSDKPIQTPRRKSRALLAYLAATNQFHNRRNLIDLFCAEAQDPPAVLRSLLSRLRRNVDQDILLADGELIRLNPAVCWVDCLAFETAVTSQQPIALTQVGTVLDLYQGEFLIDISLEDAPEFELWLLGERARYHSLYEKALSSAVDSAVAAANWDKAIHYTRRLLTANPLLEAAHGRLIWLYAQSGRLDAARNQYEIIRNLLASELAVEPAAELQHLYADIQSGKIRPQYFQVTPKPAQLSPAPIKTLIGRNAEQHHLQTAWQEAQNGKGQVILVEAEAGGGKSYLVHTFGRQLPPGRFLYGDGYESTQNVPYTPWLELLELALSHYPTAQLQTLPKEVRTAITQLIPQKTQLSNDDPLPTERLFTALASFLLHDQPRFIFIDNLQWADSASLNLFYFLARRIAQSPVALIGAFRPSLDNHLLSVLIDDLHRLHPIHLNPQPLTSANIETLLATQWPKLPADSRPRLSEMLCAATAGNPLFLTEIIRELAHTTAVPETLPIPPSILDLIRRRLQRLPASLRQVVESLAVLHAPGTPDLLQHISGRSEDETAAAFDIALTQGLIIPHDDETAGLYDFRHDLMREAVNSLLSNARRRLLHKRAAQALNPTARAAVLAYHWQKAGNQNQEAIYAAQAGEEAKSLFAIDEAITYLSRAKTLTQEPGKQISLSLQIGEILITAARWAESEKILKEALALIPEMAPDENQRILEMKIKTQLGITWVWLGNWQQAEAILKEAFETAESLEDIAEKALIQTMIGQLMTRKGLHKEALQWLTTAYETSRAAGDKFSMSRNTGGQGIVYMLMEQYREALPYFEQALALATEINEIPDIAVWIGNIGTIHKELGNLPEAVANYEQSLNIDREYGLQNQLGTGLGNLGNLHRIMGHLDKALECHLEALEIRVQVGHTAGIAYVLNGLAEDYLALNHFDAAVICFLQALDIDLALENRMGVVTQFEGLARLFREIGRLDDSLAAYHRALSLGEFVEMPATLAQCEAGKAQTELLIATGSKPETLKPAVPTSLPQIPDYITNHPPDAKTLFQKFDLWLTTLKNHP